MKIFFFFGLALLVHAAPAESQHDSRLFFGPTARSVAPGSVYITWQEFILVSGAVGVNSGVTLLGGLTIVPGTSAQFIYAAPKMTVMQHEKTAVAVGAFVGAISSELEPGGLVYGVVTRGTADAGATLGLGFAFGDGEAYSRPAIMAGFERRLTDRTHILSENYVIPGAGALFLLGVRIFDARMTFDLAGVTTDKVITKTKGLLLFPWVALTWSLR